MEHPLIVAVFTSIFLFTSLTLANQCNIGCHGTQLEKKNYVEGQIYVYELDGKSVTTVTDSQGETSFKVKATVELSVKPDCIRQLRLKDVLINGAPVALKDVEQHALQFNYHNGHVDDEICAEPKDSQASLNIKRAVISLLQSSVMQESGSTTHYEGDVFGGCTTDFSFQTDQDFVIVKKYRNLNECTNRENIREGLISATFDARSTVQSTPLMSAQQKVEQRFKQGVLNKAISTETYKFKPFSNGDAGAKTIIETVLTLKTERKDDAAAVASAASVPKTIFFESPHPVISKSSVESVMNALNAVVKEQSSDSVKFDAAQRFADFVKILRASSKKDILSVFESVKGKEKEKKIFFDGLFRTSSGEAAEVAVELIKKGEISALQALVFYTSLIFVQHVNLPAVTTITSLLDQDNLPRIGYLGIGQIIGKYCQEHTCENVPQVQAALAKISSKIGNGKANTRKEEDELISAIKALGNTRYLDEASIKKLVDISIDKSVRNRVRVAAIETLPVQCSMNWKTIIFKVLDDYEEDSEIRIKAYLSLVKCPCPHVANHVKQVLDKEKINQVGSFITSHLRNLRASADPNKQEAQKQLGLVKTHQRFPQDFRKFSFNNELSYNLDAFGIGSTIESNVIYSQNSFVPRSTSLNLTTEIFGRSFNFLQLETRVENLDKVIERYFGPKGRLRKGEPDEFIKKDVVNHLTSLGQQIKERFEKSTRGKRQVKLAEVEKFAQNVHLHENDNELDNEFDLDLSIKMFGVELAYISYLATSNDAKKYTPEYIVDKIFDALDNGIDQVKDFNYNLENHLLFLDADLTYPTGLGVPMTLGVTGSSVVNLKSSGKIDIPAMIKDPQNAFLKLAMEPSASIRVEGRLIIQGFDVESGLKVVSTLHTATGSEITVKILDGKGVDVNLNMLKRKQELISLSSQVFMSSGEKGESYVAPKFHHHGGGKGNREYVDCFDQSASIFGFSLCGKVSLPYDSIESIRKKPLFPLSGPASLAFYIDNIDVTNYHFKIFYNTKNPSSRSLEIIIETPNSRSNRYLRLYIEGAVEPDKLARVTLDSPYYKASAEAILKDNAQEHSLTVAVHHDQMHYFGKIGVKAASAGKYKPILEYKVPEHIEKLAGTKSGSGGKVVQHDGQQQYTLEGLVSVADHEGGKVYKFEKVVLTSSVGHKAIMGLDGALTVTPNARALDAKLSYGDEVLDVKLMGKRLKENHFTLTVAAVPQKDANIAFRIDWEYQREKNKFEQNLKFTHGPESQHSVNQLVLNQRAAYNFDSKNFALGFSNKLHYSALNFLFKLEGAFTKKSLQSEIIFEYDKFKFGTKLSGKTAITQPGDYQIELEGHVLKNKMEMKFKREIMSDTKSKFENSIQLTPGGKYQADALVTYDVIKPNDINVKLDGNVQLNEKKIKVDTGLEFDLQKINSHAQVGVDGIQYVDFDMKIQRAGNNPKGSVVLNLKKYILANGQYSYQNGKGSADFNVEIPKVRRKIKGTADITVGGTQHSANVEILYDAEKDPSKRIKFATVSDITKTSIDLKNIIEILSYKTEINVKGNLQGKLNDGSLNGDIDITLPNGHYITLTGKRIIKRNLSDSQLIDLLQLHIELAHSTNKGGPLRKIIYNHEGKNIDLKKITFNVAHQLKFVNFDEKDVQVGITLSKQQQQPQNGVAEVGFSLTGSVVPKPFQFDLHVEYSPNSGSWTGKSSLGNDASFQASGKYSKGNYIDKPTVLTGTMEVKLPNDLLIRNLKLDCSHSIIVPRDTTTTATTNSLMEYILSTNLVYNDDKNIKLNAHVKQLGMPLSKTSKNEGSGKITLSILNNPPLTVVGKYQADPTADTKKGSATLDVHYGEKETSINVNTEFLSDMTFFSNNIKVKTPIEKIRDLDIIFSHKKEHDGQNHNTDISVTANNNKYTIKSQIKIDPVTPSMHLIFTCPAGKTEILAKFNKLGDNEFQGQLKFDSPKVLVTSDYHIKLESVDDFIVTVNLDCDKMKQRKIHAEVANKPAKTGRKIIVTVTSDGKNIISGSTDYKKHVEAGKVIVEGKGSLKIGENTKSSLFKYIHQELTKEIDNEMGSAILLNASFGPSAVVGELKITNKEIYVFNSYCEQSKDCAHFKLQSLLDTDSKTQFNHQLTVEVDLKKFNVPAEFGLKTSTKYLLNNFSYDHTSSLYLHSSKDKTEYTTHLYVNSKESGAILTLPNRELAIISSYEMPKSKYTGAYKVDAALYLDRKNKPSDKTGMLISGHFNVERNSASLSGDAKFTYPSQPKDMMVKGRIHYGGDNLIDSNLDIDLFSKKSQKINVIVKLARVTIPHGYNYTNHMEINSQGQKLKIQIKEHLAISTMAIGLGSMYFYTDELQKPKSFGFNFFADEKEVNLLVLSPNKELINYHSKMMLTVNEQKIDSELSVLTNKPIIFNFEAKDWNSFKFSKYVKDKPNTKITGNGQFVFGQLAEVRLDAYKEGEKKNLFFALVHLDESKFLKPDFDYNKENILSTVEYIRKHFIETISQIKDILEDIGEEIVSELKDFVQHLKKAQPNLKPLMDHIQTEMNKIIEELHADETVKEIQATLKKLFGGIFEALAETIKLFTERLVDLQKKLNEIVDKFVESIKAIWPQLKESCQKILQVTVEILDVASNLALIYFKALLNVINEHQKEMKELLTVITELAHDVAKIIFKAMSQIEKDVKEFVLLLVQQLKSLPIYDIIKEKYQNIAEYQIPQTILAPIEELCFNIKNILPTQELGDLFHIICSYIIKHIKHEKVDDISEIKNIYTQTIVVVQSIIKQLHPHVSLENLFNYFEARIPADFSFLRNLPGISTLRISVLNLLRNNELPSPIDLYYAYRPTLLVQDIVPPFSMFGIVLDGGHIFTFDGRHLIVSGTCNYILSQDMVNGNFSVVANFNSGNLASITVTEPTESITIKSNGNILVNEKSSEFPSETANLKAFITPPILNIKSKYGLHLKCNNAHPMMCSLRVSGFYIGKLRGLFGDGNNEPYDDFTLPSGKITESEAAFANSYKIGTNCPASAAVEHSDSAPRAPVCTEYFSGNSPMSACFNYVNPKHYREACDYSVKLGSKKGACLVANAYFITCHYSRVMVNVPTACSSCKEGQNSITVGDSFSVKIPKKEADVIFVVEQAADNEKVFKELVTSMIPELRNELKQQEMTDVHIGLIGFNNKMKWPEHYTTGGSINIDGEVKNIKFEKLDPIVTFQEAKEGNVEKKWTYGKQRLDVELGTFRLTDAYEEAINYPFRPGAAKAIIGVFASSCEKSPLPLSLQQLRLLMGHKIYRDMGLTYHHIFLTGNTEVSGKPQKNIVGFDINNAYIFTDSKKKPLEGSNELKNNLILSDNDVCANFAVNSGGATFSAQNYLESKPSQKKQFVQVAARRVAHGLADVELEQDCTCKTYFGAYSRSICKIVNRTESGIFQKSKGTAKGG